MRLLGFALVLSMAFSAHASKLEKNMKTIDRNFKRISKQIEKDNKKEDTLKRLDAVIEAVKIAKEETPKTINKMPTEQQPEATTKYKDYLDQLVTKTEELKKSVAENNVEQAKTTLKEIDQLKKDGHKDFKKKKKKK